MTDAQRMPAVRRFEVGRTKAVDPGDGERVQQDQASSDAVDRVDAVVSEEAAEQIEPLVLWDASGRGRTVWGQFERCSAVGADGPAQEGAGLKAGSGPRREPAVDVALGASEQIGLVLAEPGEELDGD